MSDKTAYSIHGLAEALSQLDEQNEVTINSTFGYGFDELATAIMQILDGLKVDYVTTDYPESITIRICE